MKRLKKNIPGVDLIKLLRVNKVLTLFCKLDHFINISNFMAFLWKDLAYKIELVNLCQKCFMRLTPGAWTTITLKIQILQDIDRFRGKLVSFGLDNAHKLKQTSTLAY